MISFLSGLLHQATDSTVTVNVNGVGYEVFLPKSAIASLAKKGSPITLDVHTHVTESAFQLYGFLNVLEKKIFQKLISVSGIGPKGALNLISEIPVAKLLTAITQGQVAVLTNVSGIGSKTAQRLVVELKDKFQDEVFASHLTSPQTGLTGDARLQDLESVLVNLGYPETHARRMIERVQVTESDTVQTLVKKTLGQQRSADSA